MQATHWREYGVHTVQDNRTQTGFALPSSNLRNWNALNLESFGSSRGSTSGSPCPGLCCLHHTDYRHNSWGWTYLG